MQHFYTFLNWSNLNLILQQPVSLGGGGRESVNKPLVCLCVDELVSWLMGSFHLSNSVVKDCVQSLYALGQETSFHVLYLL